MANFKFRLQLIKVNSDTDQMVVWEEEHSLEAEDITGFASWLHNLFDRWFFS